MRLASFAIALLVTGCAGTEWGRYVEQAVAPVVSEPTPTQMPTPSAAEADPAETILSDLIDELDTPEPSPAIATPAPAPSVDTAATPLDILESVGILDEPVTAGSIRRSEFVRWLVLSHNLAFANQPERQVQLDRVTVPYFLDVAEDHPDFRYIQALTYAGFIEVPGERLFQPDLLLSRALFIDLKVQLDHDAPLPEADREQIETDWGFSDTDDIPDFTLNAIAADYRKTELITRVFGRLNRLEPQAPVSRAEAATALMSWGLDQQPLVPPAEPEPTPSPETVSEPVTEISPNPTEPTPESSPEPIQTPLIETPASGGFITPRND